MSNINMLLELQENYSELNQCEKLLKDTSYINTLKELKVNFENTKKEYIDRQGEIEKLKKGYSENNDQIKSMEKELKKDEYILYNEAGSDLELINRLEAKIQKLNKNIKDLEDNSLKILETEEELNKEKEKFGIKLVHLKKDFYSYKEMYNEKVAKAKEEISKIKKDITALEKTLPEELKGLFYKMVKEKGVAVAKLEGDACSCCRMKVSASTLDNVKKENEVAYCDNCGRILCK